MYSGPIAKNLFEGRPGTTPIRSFDSHIQTSTIPILPDKNQIRTPIAINIANQCWILMYSRPITQNLRPTRPRPISIRSVNADIEPGTTPPLPNKNQIRTPIAIHVANQCRIPMNGWPIPYHLSQAIPSNSAHQERHRVLDVNPRLDHIVSRISYGNPTIFKCIDYIQHMEISASDASKCRYGPSDMWCGH